MFSLKRVLFLSLFTIIGLFSINLFAAEEEKEFETPSVPDGWVYYHDVEIGKGGDKIMKIEIVAPKNDPGKLLPLLVRIHGGGWNKGSKDKFANHIVGLTKKRGYATASITYRLASKDYKNVFPAQIEDCKLAIRYLRANAKKYFIDPDKIGVWGNSAGGHLAMLLGTAPDVKELEGTGGYNDVSSKVACVVNCSGPVDFTTPFAFKYKSVNWLLGCDPKENPDKAKKAMPLTYASKNTCPILILHGDKDDVVPNSDSTNLYEGLKKAGVPDVTFKIIEGEGHNMKSPETTDLINTFLDKHLTGGVPLIKAVKKEPKKEKKAEDSE